MEAFRLLGVLLALAPFWVGRPTVALAAEHASVRWNAPDACPDDAAALAQIAGFLGQELQATAPQELAISAQLQGSPEAGFSAKLVFRAPNGSSERFLDHPDCTKLTEAAALLIALTIDPERVRARQAEPPLDASPAAEPAPASAPAPPIAPSSPAPPSAPASPPADRARPMEPTGAPYRVMLALFGVGGAGALPSWGWGTGGDVGLRRGRFRLTVAGRYWGPRTRAAENAPPGEVSLSLVTVGLRVCGLPVIGDWTLAACATADVGDMFGDAQQVENSRTRHDRYSALGAGLNVSYARWTVAPFGGLEIAGALDRPSFGVSHNGQAVEAFRPEGWAFGAFLGLAFER